MSSSKQSGSYSPYRAVNQAYVNVPNSTTTTSGASYRGHGILSVGLGLGPPNVTAGANSQGGYISAISMNQHQSFSGSETDVSTSTENLTHEEKYFLRHTTRQEPQGEEGTSTGSYGYDASGRSYDASSCNTMIIHSDSILDEKFDAGLPTESRYASSSGLDTPKLPPPYSIALQSKQNTPVYSTSASGMSRGSSTSRAVSSQGLGFLGSKLNSSLQEITEIPSHYLDQSQVLKHLAKEVRVPIPTVCSSPALSTSTPTPTPTPATQESNQRLLESIYNLNISAESKMELVHKLGLSAALSESMGMVKHGSWRQGEVEITELKSPERLTLSLSRSQPDLTKLELLPHSDNDLKLEALSPGGEKEMIDMLSQENSALKLELEMYHKRVAKLQKFELELQKVQQSHEFLVKSSERREILEKTARQRLQNEIRRLQSLNKHLSEQLDLTLSQLGRRGSGDSQDDQQRDLRKQDIFITQLISQNRELATCKERQEIELAAQRATLQEQRQYIDVLDSALTNAQANVVRLEEDCRKKQVYVERVAQLQRSLSSLQLSSDRRQDMELRLRQQLEKEIADLRAEKEEREKGRGKEDGEKARDAREESGETKEELKQLVRSLEEKILMLEDETTRWEQRYLEESALRQLAIDAASMPKDAKIAALEKTSQQSEKLIAQARSDKVKHLEELHSLNKKNSQYEERIKDLESKLGEKEAMIKVLERHSHEKDVVYQSFMFQHRTSHAHSHSHSHSHSRSILSARSASNDQLDSVMGGGRHGKAASLSLEPSVSSPTLPLSTWMMEIPKVKHKGKDADRESKSSESNDQEANEPDSDLGKVVVAARESYYEGLLKLWKSQGFCDLHLIARDGSVHCHRHILSRASPFLHSLLTSCPQGELCSITLPHLNVRTLNALVGLLYGDTLRRMSSTDVIELLNVAVELKIHPLVDFLTSTLTSSLQGEGSEDDVITIDEDEDQGPLSVSTEPGTSGATTEEEQVLRPSAEPSQAGCSSLAYEHEQGPSESFTQRGYRSRFTCRACGRQFSSRRHLHQHSVQAHNKNSSKKNWWKCQHCNRAFSSVGTYTVHQKHCPDDGGKNERRQRLASYAPKLESLRPFAGRAVLKMEAPRLSTGRAALKMEAPQSSTARTPRIKVESPLEGSSQMQQAGRSGSQQRAFFCTNCKTSVVGYDTYKHHVYLCSGDETSGHPCPDCKTWFARRLILEAHRTSSCPQALIRKGKVSQEEYDQLKCSNCDKVFDNYKGWFLHKRRMVHFLDKESAAAAQNRSPLPPTLKRMSDPSGNSKKMTARKSSIGLSCSYCHKVQLSDTVRRQHERRCSTRYVLYGLISEEESQSLCCNSCNKSFTRYQDVVRHKSQAHRLQERMAEFLSLHVNAELPRGINPDAIPNGEDVVDVEDPPLEYVNAEADVTEGAPPTPQPRIVAVCSLANERSFINDIAAFNDVEPPLLNSTGTHDSESSTSDIAL